MRVTKEDLDAAVGTPRETTVKLDWMLQCYGDLEKRHAECGRRIRALESALHEISHVEFRTTEDMQQFAREALA